MEQLTKNQAVATSQEAVQNQNEPQLRDENAHNDKSVHGVLNPTYQAGLRRDAVQPDIEAERKKRDEIEAGKRSEERFSRNAETDLVCRLLLEKKKKNMNERITYAVDKSTNTKKQVMITRETVRITALENVMTMKHLREEHTNS